MPATIHADTNRVRQVTLFDLRDNKMIVHCVAFHFTYLSVFDDLVDEEAREWD